MGLLIYELLISFREQTWLTIALSNHAVRSSPRFADMAINQMQDSGECSQSTYVNFSSSSLLLLMPTFVLDTDLTLLQSRLRSRFDDWHQHGVDLIDHRCQPWQPGAAHGALMVLQEELWDSVAKG